MKVRHVWFVICSVVVVVAAPDWVPGWLLGNAKTSDLTVADCERLLQQAAIEVRKSDS